MKKKSSKLPERILAWELGYPDNDSYMLLGSTETVTDPILRRVQTWRFVLNGRPHPATCERCGRRTDGTYINPEFRAKKRKYALSSTYDGYTLASRAFRSFVESRGYAGVEFVSLPADPDFFVLRIHNVLPFGKQGKGVQTLENSCDVCRGYGTVIAPELSDLARLNAVHLPLADGFYRTDLEYGSGHEQHPIEILGATTAEPLRSLGFAHLTLEKIVAR